MRVYYIHKYNELRSFIKWKMGMKVIVMLSIFFGQEVKKNSFVIIFLILLGWNFIADAKGDPAVKICGDQRIKMNCQGGAECTNAMSSWSVVIEARVKKFIDAGANINKKKRQDIDKGLERMKEIENTACVWWNACMDMDDWINLRKQTFESMMLGVSLSKQRGSTNSNADDFVNSLNELEDFYQNGIEEKFKENDAFSR